MPACKDCGKPVEFRFIDGRYIPLHTSGGCVGKRSGKLDSESGRDAESACRKTSCPVCKAEVYFIKHNGGSVWIDAPLGPPWNIHPCIPGNKASNTLVSKKLFAELGLRDGIITGVVSNVEEGKDKLKAIIDIAIGEEDRLSLLIERGRESLLDQVVLIDPERRLVYWAPSGDVRFNIMTVLAGPGALVGRGGPLRRQLSPDELQRLRAECRYGKLSPDQHRVLREFQSRGLSGEWKLSHLLSLIPLLSGKNFEQAVHMAAVNIIERAEKHGDCSGAATLISLVGPTTRKRLNHWFWLHSPIRVDLKRKQKKAYIYKTATGERRPFLTAASRATRI